MAAIVSIGRNIGARPMSSSQWAEFKRTVVDVVRLSSPAIYFAGEGKGIHDGIAEESFTVVAEDPRSEIALSAALRVVARHHRQESIALTIGPTRFVG